MQTQHSREAYWCNTHSAVELMDHDEPIGEECSLEGPFDDFGTAQRFGLRDNQPEIARRNWNRLLGDIPGLESL